MPAAALPGALTATSEPPEAPPALDARFVRPVYTVVPRGSGGLRRRAATSEFGAYVNHPVYARYTLSVPVSFVRHATTFLDESESRTEGW